MVIVEPKNKDSGAQKGSRDPQGINYGQIPEFMLGADLSFFDRRFEADLAGRTVRVNGKRKGLEIKGKHLKI